MTNTRQGYNILEDPNRREPVHNRLALIDGDIIAYLAAGSTQATDIEKVQKLIDDILEDIKYSTGSQGTAIYLTGDPTKGDRVYIASTKPYKGNRKDTPKPKYLDDARQYLIDSQYCYVTKYGEADDALVEAQDDNTIIVTSDKDLRQAYGWHYDLNTQEEFYVEPYTMGYLHLTDKPTKKLKGTSWLWFWAQMLTGDTADNIPGVPKIGAVKAYGLLKDVKTNLEAMDIVLEQYKEGYPETWHDVFIEQYKLLAMDRHGYHKGVPGWMDFSKIQ